MIPRQITSVLELVENGQSRGTKRSIWGPVGTVSEIRQTINEAVATLQRRARMMFISCREDLVFVWVCDGNKPQMRSRGQHPGRRVEDQFATGSYTLGMLGEGEQSVSRCQFQEGIEVEGHSLDASGESQFAKSCCALSATTISSSSRPNAQSSVGKCWPNVSDSSVPPSFTATGLSVASQWADDANNELFTSGQLSKKKKSGTLSRSCSCIVQGRTRDPGTHTHTHSHHTPTHIHTHTLSHTHFRTHTFTLAHTLTHTPSHTLSLTRTISHTHTHNLTHSHTQSHTHSHTTLFHTKTHRHTHTRTHTHTHTFQVGSMTLHEGGAR